MHSRSLVKAAQGQSQRVKQLMTAAPQSVGVEQRGWVRSRAANLIRTGVVDDANRPVSVMHAQLVTDQDSRPQDTQPGALSTLPVTDQQLTVDVTVILSYERKSSVYGVNLLDGLQGIYSFGRYVQITKSNVGDVEQTTITRAIQIPDITYNLNIFN
jgi:hypothetical protein